MIFSVSDQNHINEILTSLNRQSDLMVLRLSQVQISNSVFNNISLANTQLSKKIKAEFIIKKNKQPQKSLQAEFDIPLPISEIVNFVQSDDHFDQCSDKLNCYIEGENQLLDSNCQVDENFDGKVFIFDQSDNLFEITLKIMENDQQIQVQQCRYDKSIMLQEIYDKIKDDFKIQGNKWTCYSERNQDFIRDTKTIIDQSYHLDTFIIDTTESRLLKKSVSQQCSPIKQFFCQEHNQIFEFICIKADCGKRKLCIYCVEKIDKYHTKKDDILTIDDFIASLKRKTDRLQNLIASSAKIKYNQLKERIQEIYEKYRQNLEQAFSFENASFKLGEEIQKKLKGTWLDSTDFINEMAYVLSNQYIENKILINSINEKTIQQNLLKFETFVNQFEQQITSLEFQTIPLHQCEIGKNSQGLKLNYQGKNTLQLPVEDDQYGKILIQPSDIKLQILVRMKNKVTLDYDINKGKTLKDIYEFVKQKLKITHDFKKWRFVSQVKNDLVDDPQQCVCELILQDVIKIEITSLIVDDIKMIDLNIDIINGPQSRKIQQSFSELCTLFDIENEVLEFCKIKKDQSKIEIIFKINDHKYLNNDFKNQTLLQLKLTSDSKIAVIIKTNNQIQLQCMKKIDEKPILITLLLKKTISDLVEDLILAWNVDKQFQTIDIFIDEILTFEELGIANNQIIIGRLRWIGE